VMSLGLDSIATARYHVDENLMASLSFSLSCSPRVDFTRSKQCKFSHCSSIANTK
jgi:hypothetical protein